MNVALDCPELAMTREQVNDPAILEIFGRIAIFFKWQPEKIPLWFCSSNPLLGGVKPIEMIHKHRQEKLLKFIKNQLDGNTP